MAGDRDLAVAFARALPPLARGGRTGWEMTAATGVRGLRLLNESGAFDSFTFSEANPEAFRVLRENVARVPGARAVEGDARSPPSDGPFDYVDIDPYGTPVPFVPAALASVRPGGVLAATATDMMVLAGVQPGASEQRYGARPVRGRLAPEGGLRILLAYLARAARTRSLRVRPLLSYARDHYVRAYLEVRSDEGGGPADPIAPIDPARWDGPPIGNRGPYGPLWIGPLFDAGLVEALAVPTGAARPAELEQFFERLRDEARVDRPFYYESNRLAADLRLSRPPSVAEILATLRARGYGAARTHARPEGVRTDAPRSVVEEAVRSLVAQSQNARVRA